MRKAGQIFANDPRHTTASGNPALGDAAGGWVRGKSDTRTKIQNQIKARDEKRKIEDPEGYQKMINDRAARRQRKNTPRTPEEMKKLRQYQEQLRKEEGIRRNKPENWENGKLVNNKAEDNVRPENQYETRRAQQQAKKPQPAESLNTPSFYSPSVRNSRFGTR